MAAPADIVTVGGKGGYEFSFKSDSNFTSNVTIKKLSVSYSETVLNSVQVIFSCGQTVKVGTSTGSKSQDFEFEDGCLITSATLWPNKAGDKFGGVEFEVSNREETSKETVSVKCEQLGEPVYVNTKCGVIYGIGGRSGSDIDALGFYFI